jgi:hypothetical protein
MIEHDRKQNAAGNDVVIVEVSGDGGGAFLFAQLRARR